MGGLAHTHVRTRPGPRSQPAADPGRPRTPSLADAG